MKYFNTEGLCDPNEHYMVRLDSRLDHIKRFLVDRKKYFVINKGRQYGKTTTLRALEGFLKDDYTVLSLDFQQLSTADFADEPTFVRAFARVVKSTIKMNSLVDMETLLASFAGLSEKENHTMQELFEVLSLMCKNSAKSIVLMIDEVDNASNNQVFIDFLGMLRMYYLNRDRMPTFYSVILAGVYDIKNLKLKIRPDAEHQYNSPWNIAANFDIEMSFSVGQIATMLQEYETDHHTGMDVRAVAEEIYAYTSGYPVLVSAICKCLDEDLVEDGICEGLDTAWTKAGVAEAVKSILRDRSPLFESMIRHLDQYSEMKRMFQGILFQGSDFSYSPDTKEISLACMFGYAVNVEGKVRIANRIFEMRLYNYFLSEEELSGVMGKMAQRDKSYFIHDGHLDMDMTLKKFVDYFTDIYGKNDEKFIEDHGRKLFLLFLRPIINGVGNYYIEAQTRDARRTDIIVDYLGEQFIIELKIWYGSEYHDRGVRQLTEYLDYYHKDKGYMISFNFNKKKDVGVKEIQVGSKTIVEAVV